MACGHPFFGAELLIEWSLLGEKAFWFLIWWERRSHGVQSFSIAWFSRNISWPWVQGDTLLSFNCGHLPAHLFPFSSLGQKFWNFQVAFKWPRRASSLRPPRGSICSPNQTLLHPNPFRGTDSALPPPVCSKPRRPHQGSQSNESTETDETFGEGGDSLLKQFENESRLGRGQTHRKWRKDFWSDELEKEGPLKPDEIQWGQVQGAC